MTCFIHCSLPRVAASVACLLALFAPQQSRSHVLKGAQTPLAWEMLVLAKANPKKPGAEVEFPAALTGLNGKAVVVKGFMVPLEAKAEQTRFLLTQKPQDCEFCIDRYKHKFRIVALKDGCGKAFNCTAVDGCESFDF